MQIYYSFVLQLQRFDYYCACSSGQMLNENEQPIYGAYVRGRYWHFVLLDGANYAVHDGFNALTDDLQKILEVLNRIILRRQRKRNFVGIIQIP